MNNNSNGVARIGSLPCFTKCISTCSITTKYPAYLPIPRLFYDMYSNDLQRDVVLKVSKSRRWEIKLGAVKGGLYAFRGIGWVKFVQDNGVKVGDRIMFTMLSGSLFAVKFLNSEDQPPQQQPQVLLLPVKQEVVDSGDGGNVEDESPPPFHEEQQEPSVKPAQEQQIDQEKQQQHVVQAQVQLVQEQQQQIQEQQQQQQQPNLKRRRETLSGGDYDDNEADSARTPNRCKSNQQQQQQIQHDSMDDDVSPRPNKRAANGSVESPPPLPPPLGSSSNPLIVDLWKSSDHDEGNNLHLILKTGPNEGDKQYRLLISTSEIKQLRQQQQEEQPPQVTTSTAETPPREPEPEPQDLIAAAAAAEETALAAATAVVPVDPNDSFDDEDEDISGGNIDGDDVSGKSNHLSVGIKTSNLAPYCKFPVPKDFAKQWLPGHSTNVIVVDSVGTKHTMSWIVGGKRMLGKGWSNFVRQHNLQLGYRCDMEVVEPKLVRMLVYDHSGRLVTPVIN